MREASPSALWQPLSRKEHKRRLKRQHRSKSQWQQAVTSPVYVCIDWGASYWRQFTSLLGVSPPEPSLVVYNKTTKELITGQRASNAWLSNTCQVRFENLKALFDEDSGFWEAECRRIEGLGLELDMDAVLEKWWYDRIGPLLKRVGPRETIVFAVAHPAHFSARSVQRLRDFFAKRREGRDFNVVMSEEATAALHGSSYSGFVKGDIVLVVDGGKSTIDCACLEITSDDPSLTTLIFKTEGLAKGADHINQVARRFADEHIQRYKNDAPRDVQEVMATESFERALEAWWYDFEVRCKRDLRLSQTSALLEKIILVPVPGLLEEVKKVSLELAERTKQLIEGMASVIEQMTGRRPTSIICVGGYCQSRDLRDALSDMRPPPQFEGDSDGNDVIAGLRSLALHPERAEWQCSPQHYLIPQDGDDGNREALLMCMQGQVLAKSHEATRLHSVTECIRARRQSYPNPYHMPGHLVQMAVSIDADNMNENEEIIHELEIRTADILKLYRNKQGFQVSDLANTIVLQRYHVSLPDHYRELFRQHSEIPMYVCITIKGQDIVLNALRPRDCRKTPYIEWMTLPEIIGTYGADSIEIFKTSVQITAASRQGIVPDIELSKVL